MFSVNIIILENYMMVLVPFRDVLYQPRMTIGNPGIDDDLLKRVPRGRYNLCYKLINRPKGTLTK